MFELAQKKQKILEIEDQMASPNFWSDQQRTKEIAQELDALRNQALEWEKLEKDLDELQSMAEMAQKEGDKALESDLKAKFSDLKALFEHIRLSTFLSGKYDKNHAFLSIHAGAGGVDAQDWAEMLRRMYLRFAEKEKFKAAIIDESRGLEAGIKSTVMEIVGPHAFGYLKGEAGVHRLVRLSPFNPAHTRETSFALVEVLPSIDHSEYKLSLAEVEIEAKTSRGHGGQSVNTTYSAIRATHKPTGITVTIQNERSQTQNKEQALKILAAKLMQLEEEKRQAEKLKIRGEFKSAEWGNQIRSYVLHPYKLVKDHRTNYEISDAEAVLDGNLEGLIKAYLEYARK
ncbi:MAG: peptide chain release factor 2 [Candidatus Doudnabacteria bacterium]|nr:peptide chain release factor 2 [Candidatus Doudnabacteria bacterium]